MKTIIKGLIILFLITPHEVESQNQWNIISPIGTGNGLLSIIYLDDVTSMAVGGGGTLIKTTNGGNTWNVINTGFNYTLSCIFSTDANNIYIGTRDQQTLTSSNGGKTWISSYDSDLTDIASIYFTSENIGYAVGSFGRAFGYIYKTTDRGKSWVISRHTGYSKMKKVIFQNVSTGFAVGDDGQILKTTNSGETWVNKTPPIYQALYDISFYDEYTGFISGGGGTIFKTTDSGENWITVNYGEPFTQELRNIIVKDSLNIIVTGDRFDIAAIIAYSTDGGLNWNNFDYSEFKPTLSSVTKIKSNYFLGTSINGCTYKFDYNDHTISISNAITDNNLNGVDFANTSIGFMCGGNGSIFKTSNAGESWTKIYSLPSLNLISIKAYDENRLIAGSSSNMLLRSVDGGKYFGYFSAQINGSSIKYFNFPKYSNTGINIYLIAEKSLWPPSHGSYYILYKSTTFGDSWDQVYTNSSYISSTYFYDENTGYIGFNSGNIKKTTNGGANWQDLSVNPGGDMAHLISFPSLDTGYIIGNVLKKTTNGGSTWFSVSDSSFIPMTTSLIFKDNNNGILLGNNGIRFTTDGGIHWMTQIEHTGLNSIALTDNNKGYCVGNGGTIMNNNNSFPVGIHNFSNLIPEKSELYQNYPNPFNPSTNIEFEISEMEYVSLKLYDMLGKEIKTLVNETKPAGRYTVSFYGSNLPSGIYFYKIETGNFTQVKKMMLIK